VAVSDFNGDGWPDLAVACFGNVDFRDGGVSLLFGRSDGTFEPAVTKNAGASIKSVAVGDFNGDGKPDLVAASQGFFDRQTGTYTNAGLWVMLGNGDGTFQAPVI